MNLKLLIFGVFTAWIVFCTKWYVCEIQHSCYEGNTVETVSGTSETVRPAVSEPLALASDPATVSRKTEVKRTEQPPATAPKPKQAVSTPSVKKSVAPTTARKVVAGPKTVREVEPVAISSNLTAKGGSPVISKENKSASKSTRQILVESGKNKLTICYPQQYTARDEVKATERYLTDLVAQWKKNGGRIVITGHTDFVGSSDSNYEVGLERAESIRDILENKGVPASKIRCISEGEDLPRATNDTPYGRFQNRRVEVVIKR